MGQLVSKISSCGFVDVDVIVFLLVLVGVLSELNSLS